MKKNQRKIGIFLLVVIILVFLWQYNGFFGLLAILPTSGAQPVPNPSGGYEFNIVNTPLFSCDYDECIVSGSMVVTKPTVTDTLQCSDCTYNNGKNKATLLVNSGIYDRVERCSPAIDRPTSDGWYACKGSIITEYKATFNFCPNDPGFPYCSGTKNLVGIGVDSSSTYFTEEKLIKRNEQVSFNPKYLDNSPIESYSIKVKKYDLSCLPAIEQGDACSPNQIYCQPSPSNDFLVDNKCYGSGGINQAPNCPSGSRPQLRLGTNNCGSSLGGAWCTGQSTYTKYLKCDDTQQIGQSTCNDFSSNLNSCPTGQQCYVGGQLKEGIGACSCTPNACDGNSLGYKQALSENTYRECVAVGSCTDWSSFRTCPTGLVFNQNLQSCVFLEENSCSPNEAECVGTTQLRVCELVSIGGITGYQWSTTLQNALGEKLCDNKGNNLPDDSWSCNNVDSCEVGKIQCDSISTYLTCAKNPSDVSNSCYKFRDLGGQVGQYEQCVNNQISQRNDIGCQFGTPGFECSTQQDINNVKIEQCVNNQCTPTQDSNTATESDFLNQRTRCSGNTIQKVTKYPLTSGNIYRFETKTDTQNSLLGTCNTDFTCIELLSGSASCQLNAQFVGIISQDSFGIGKPITATIKLTDQVPNKVGLPILAQIFNGENEIAEARQTNKVTDSKGEAKIDFNGYAHSAGGSTLTIKVTVDPQGVNYQQTKTIKIQSTLNIVLTCPPQGYIGKEVKCTFRVYDLDNPNVLVPQVSFEYAVTQGQDELGFTPSSSDISFIANKQGSVDVYVKASKTGYISDDSKVSVPIQTLTQSQDFLIDTNDFFTYSGSGITTGTHQLEFSVVDSSGSAEEVLDIQATITPPNGISVPVTFSKTSGGSLKTTYNFNIPGNTYRLDGIIRFVDTSKPEIPFTYSISTIASNPDVASNTYLIIILVAGGIVFLFAIIIYFFVRKKK